MAVRLLSTLAVAILLFSAQGVILAQPAAGAWRTADGGGALTRPAFWEALPGVTASNGRVVLDGQSDPSVGLVDRYGPRIDAGADFRVVASVQAATDTLALLTVLDAAAEGDPSPASPRVEAGLQHGQVLFQVFDGSTAEPLSSQAFDTDTPLGPLTLAIARLGATVSLEVSGQHVLDIEAPAIFASGTALLGARVATDNQLTLNTLEVQVAASGGQSISRPVTRCAPDRLLVAGSPPDTTDVTGLYWLWPDSGLLRPIELRQDLRSFLVALSPDNRWVAYYQRSPQNVTDRFVVDTWVLDVATDERVKLVDGNAPLGWIASSTALVLGERPSLMAAVPSGELLPTDGQLIMADAMRMASSPDGRYRAVVSSTPEGAAGINILDTASGELTMSVPTGRGAVELAWGPDSNRLAFTSATDSPAGLIWKLRMLDVAAHSAVLVEPTQDMAVHSVVWTPRLAGCS